MAFGSMNDGGEDAPMSDINVTPLVDVMLVLLIVFMITMPVLTHSVQINLPTSNSNTPTQTHKDIKPLDIAINASGQYAIGAESSEFIDQSAVEAQLKAIYAQDKDTIIAIDADEQVPYEKVAKLLEMAQDIGFTKVGFRFKVENQTP